MTTAASLWVCGGIGIAIGGGFYIGGLVTAGITLISLRYLNKIEKAFKKRNRKIILLCQERADLLRNLANVFAKNNIRIKDLKVNKDELKYDYSILERDDTMPLDKDILEIECSLIFEKQLDINKFQMELSEIEGVEQVKLLS